jgi:hypothetical protein
MLPAIERAARATYEIFLREDFLDTIIVVIQSPTFPHEECNFEISMRAATVVGPCVLAPATPRRPLPSAMTIILTSVCCIWWWVLDGVNDVHDGLFVSTMMMMMMMMRSFSLRLRIVVFSFVGICVHQYTDGCADLWKNLATEGLQGTVSH